MKKVYGAMIALAFVIFFGTFGAIETDSVTLGQGIVQIGASALMGIVGGLMYRMERRRHDSR